MKNDQQERKRTLFGVESDGFAREGSSFTWESSRRLSAQCGTRIERHTGTALATVSDLDVVELLLMSNAYVSVSYGPIEPDGL